MKTGMKFFIMHIHTHFKLVFSSNTGSKHATNHFEDFRFKCTTWKKRQIILEYFNNNFQFTSEIPTQTLWISSTTILLNPVCINSATSELPVIKKTRNAFPLPWKKNFHCSGSLPEARNKSNSSFMEKQLEKIGRKT